MQQNKRSLSTNEDLRKYCCIADSPMNSPRKYMCIPNNTPQASPEHLSMEIRGENIHKKWSLSAVDQPTFISKDFQNEVVQALLTKFPDEAKIENSPLFWLADSKTIPSISVFPESEVPKYVGDSDSQLTIENLENFNRLCINSLPKSLEKIEPDRNSLISDQASNMATCASDVSDRDSLSDFEEEEVFKRTQSVCLDESELESLKYQSASLNDIRDIGKSPTEFKSTIQIPQ